MNYTQFSFSITAQHNNTILHANISQVVVLVNQNQELQLKINDITHPKKIGFISVESRGVFGSVFTDYGEEFTVIDTTGEPPVSHMIASISNVINYLVLLWLFLLTRRIRRVWSLW